MHTKHRDTDATVDENSWDRADAKVFSDAGWTVPRSMTGVAGKASGMLVLSKATLQTSVATSSTDAEVQGLCASTKEAIWMRDPRKPKRPSPIAFLSLSCNIGLSYLDS